MKITRYSLSLVSSFPLLVCALDANFIPPGIPGPYVRPPIGETGQTPSMWYVVTKGLYVGIFTNW